MLKTGHQQSYYHHPGHGRALFGTNVIEAIMVTLMGRAIDKISPADYFSMLQELNLKPGVVNLEEFSA